MGKPRKSKRITDTPKGANSSVDDSTKLSVGERVKPPGRDVRGSYPKAKTVDDIKLLASTVGAMQDTIRVHADALNNIHQYLYAVIISLDLVYMDIVQMLPEEERENILQNNFDESLTGFENDVVALNQIKEYVESRIESCREAIKNYESSPKTTARKET